MTVPPRFPEPGSGDLWPTVSDRPPGKLTGVPVERDPRTGTLLSGGPGGRSDKGRSTPPSRVVALVTAAALVVAAAVAALLLNRGDDPAPAAVATSTSSAAPTSTTPPPPVDPGPRTVPVTVTTVSVTPPPGFAPDPTFGAAGEVRSRTWTLTGPCDGTGACTILHCTAPGQCFPPLVATPNGAGDWVENAAPLTFTGANGTPCGIFLGHYSLASA